MKRLIIGCVLLMLCVSSAMAEGWEVDTDSTLKYQVETFQDELPGELRSAMAATTFAEDEILCGATLAYISKSTGETKAQIGLIAVEHDGQRLLLGAHRKTEGWRILPESETLLRRKEDFTITVAEGFAQDGGIPDTIRTADVLLAIDYGEDMFLLKPSFGYSMYSMITDTQWFNLYSYVRVDEQGNGLTITCEYEGKPWVVRLYQAGQASETISCAVRWPIGAAYMNGDTFPRDAAQLEAWAAENPVDESSAWVKGANLRELATAESASLGMYSIAPLEILKRRSGKIDYWYKVNIGDTTGWISGTYVDCGKEDDSAESILRSQCMPAIAAAAEGEINLCATPEGEAVQSLADGTGMRILGLCGEWYHVQIPQGDMSWQLDVPAVYGYVRQTEVQVYDTELCMKYRAR